MLPPHAAPLSEEQLLAQPRYRCCCGSCNVKKGTWIIAILEAVLLSLSIILTIIAFFVTKSQVSIWQLIIYLIFAHGLGFIVVLFLFIGLNTKKGGYLLVYIIYMIIQIIGIIILLVLLVLIFFFGGLAALTADKGGDNAANSAAFFAIGIVFIVVIGFSLFFSIWQTTIVMRCRQFFNELEMSKLPPVYYHPA